ncbi:MAG: rRNA maturation RNase YbeY [Candidatus Pelagibacter sp.]|nr:rRNA maturation RNase YbeY [Candidatus Pelagibacter sp.]
MIKVNLITDSVNWRIKIPNLKKYFKKRLIKLSKINAFKDKKHELSILLTNNRKLRILNKKFRNKNNVTDVLSFPLRNLSKRKNYIGDIAISYEIINERSKKTDFNFEFDRIWIHGYLHLIGYNHIKNNEYKKMIIKEREILKKLDHKYNLQT